MDGEVITPRNQTKTLVSDTVRSPSDGERAIPMPERGDLSFSRCECFSALTGATKGNSLVAVGYGINKQPRPEAERLKLF